MGEGPLQRKVAAVPFAPLEAAFLTVHEIRAMLLRHPLNGFHFDLVSPNTFLRGGVRPEASQIHGNGTRRRE